MSKLWILIDQAPKNKNLAFNQAKVVLIALKRLNQADKKSKKLLSS